jgi:hypothetical protein
MNEVQVCVSDYLAADDLGGKEITVTISAVDDLSPADRDREKQEAASARKRGKTPRKTSKDVLLSFKGAKKQMRCNPTNQWSIALLFGTKKASEWIGKRITLRTDIDINVESGDETGCLRIATSPDAAPTNAAAYKRAWSNGNRKRGSLCKRCKDAFRAINSGARRDESEGPDGDDEPPPMPAHDPSDDVPPETPMREPGQEG